MKKVDKILSQLLEENFLIKETNGRFVRYDLKSGI